MLHIITGYGWRNWRISVPMNGENGKIKLKIAELYPKYSPLRSGGAILEMNTWENWDVMFSPSVKTAAFASNI